jgi:hypothetical protein
MKKNTFTSKSAKTACKIEILHDVAAGEVATKVAVRMNNPKNPKCRSYKILPEDDGEFTLIFFYAV